MVALYIHQLELRYKERDVLSSMGLHWEVQQSIAQPPHRWASASER